jgi:ornithine cyclodeaminase
MQIVVLSHHDVERLLPMAECIDAMEAALAALSAGHAHMPLRTVVRPPGAAGLMGLMPAYRGGAAPLYGLKAVCVFPGNSAIGKDSHQGSVMLFDGASGELLALINAAAVTAIRTGAVSGLATRLLARPDAGDLALIGAGVQARTQLAAVAAVRPLRRVRVAARSLESARRLAAELAPAYPFPIEAVAGAEEALRDADLIVTATTSAEPVLRREWIAPGAHINAVGSSIPTARELDTATISAARLFVDRRESTLNESGDFLFAQREGAVGPEHILAEIGEVAMGARPGRGGPGEITLFKSLGLAVEDMAAAELLYRKARAQGAGAWVEF